jgi:hypothetical protein
MTVDINIMWDIIKEETSFIDITYRLLEYIFNKDNNLYSNIEICFDKNEKDKYIRIYSNNKKLFLNIKKNSITLNKIDLSKLEKCLIIDFVSFTSKSSEPTLCKVVDGFYNILVTE